MRYRYAISQMDTFVSPGRGCWRRRAIFAFGGRCLTCLKLLHCRFSFFYICFFFSRKRTKKNNGMLILCCVAGARLHKQRQQVFGNASGKAALLEKVREALSSAILATSQCRMLLLSSVAVSPAAYSPKSPVLFL